ncbi:sodium:proton antiporter, partial [Aeromicrobium sp. PE09-221]
AFVVGGTALVDPDLDDLVKVIIAIALQLATSVVGGVAIARSAVLSGHGFDDTDTSDLHD